MTRAPALALAALLTSSCGASLLKLPPGPGVAAPDAADALTEATSACRAVTSLTTEISVSGSANGQRVRARLVAGAAAPASARLEAYAFGQPMFTFVAVANDASLLLDRDQQALEHESPEDILEALTGVPLDAAALRTTLTGCTQEPDSAGARQLENDWRRVPAGTGAVYLHRGSHDGPWQVTAATRRSTSGIEWQEEYRNHANGLPREVRLISSDRRRFNLRLEIVDMKTNVAIEAQAFRLQVPASVDRITLTELRRSGPFAGAADGADGR